jgi:4-hydroxybenzoate polyprenyltransferase
MSNKIKEKNIILVFLTEFIRIKDVTLWFATSFLGFLLAITSLSINKYIEPFFVFAISTFFIIAFAAGINNYYDVNTDKKNPRRRNVNAIASGKISKQTATLINIIFVFIPVIVTLLYKFEIFLFCVILLILMWTYSAPPLRFKGRPGFDIIWHFFAFFLLILWGIYIAGTIDILNLLFAFSIGIFSCIAQVYNHIYDYAYDKADGTITFAVWAGLDITKTTLLILTFIHIIALIPIIILYSIDLWVIIIILMGSILIGIFKTKPKLNLFSIRKSYFFIMNYFSLLVYISVLLFHLFSLIGTPIILN